MTKRHQKATCTPWVSICLYRVLHGAERLHLLHLQHDQHIPALTSNSERSRAESSGVERSRAESSGVELSSCRAGSPCSLSARSILNSMPPSPAQGPGHRSCLKSRDNEITFFWFPASRLPWACTNLKGMERKRKTNQYHVTIRSESWQGSFHFPEFLTLTWHRQNQKRWAGLSRMGLGCLACATSRHGWPQSKLLPSDSARQSPGAENRLFRKSSVHQRWREDL